MISRKSSTAPAEPNIAELKRLLEHIVLDCIAIRKLCSNVHDEDSMTEAGLMVNGIDALVTRSGRAADDCAELLGGKAWSDWKDFPGHEGASMGKLGGQQS